MSKPLAIQHLNSCVYETVKSGDDFTPLMKQVNNPIPVIGVVTARRHSQSFNSLRSEFEKIYRGENGEPIKVFHMFPLKEEEFDTPLNYTIVYGHMVETRKKDPTVPVGVPEGISSEDVLKDVLTPYDVTVPFLIAFVESDRYFFDISISHIPEGAMIEAPEQGTIPFNTMEESLPIGLDPRGFSISEEDYNKMKQEEK